MGICRGGVSSTASTNFFALFEAAGSRINLRYSVEGKFRGLGLFRKSTSLEEIF